jgi:hypothetical protein
MTRTGHCKHERTQFHSIQRLGPLPPLELRQCLDCRSTVAIELDESELAGAVAAAGL